MYFIRFDKEKGGGGQLLKLSISSITKMKRERIATDIFKIFIRFCVYDIKLINYFV